MARDRFQTGMTIPVHRQAQLAGEAGAAAAVGSFVLATSRSLKAFNSRQRPLPSRCRRQCGSRLRRSRHQTSRPVGLRRRRRARSVPCPPQPEQEMETVIEVPRWRGGFLVAETERTQCLPTVYTARNRSR